MSNWIVNENYVSAYGENYREFEVCYDHKNGYYTKYYLRLDNNGHIDIGTKQSEFKSIYNIDINE